jgi:hypothetical protein
MSRIEYPPMEVIPINETPSSEVLSAWAGTYYSDIFPTEKYEDSQGMLGVYLGGDPNPGDPLNDLVEGIRSQRSVIYGIEDANGGRRTEETSRALYATMLHSQLASRINQAYKNLRQDGSTPAYATDVIATYIDVRYQQNKKGYSRGLEFNVAELAALERGENVPQPDSINGIPVLRLSGMLEVPESPEVEMAALMNFRAKNIKLFSDRLKRLDFERLSSDTILEILKSNVDLS